MRQVLTERGVVCRTKVFLLRYQFRIPLLHIDEDAPQNV